MARCASSLLLGLGLLLCGPLPGAAADVQPWLVTLDRAERELKLVDGYSAVFHKKEWLNNRMVVSETMRIKFRKPFSVYFEWVNVKGTGGEAIYVDGWNRNRIRVHPGGFWGILNFNLDPDGRRVMKTNRHSITRFGVGQLIGLIGTNVRRAISATEFAAINHGPAEIHGRSAVLLEAVLPIDPAKGYWCRRAEVHFDTETGLPLNIRNYDWDDRLVEEYGYENFRIETALTDADFDPENPAYRF